MNVKHRDIVNFYNNYVGEKATYHTYRRRVLQKYQNPEEAIKPVSTLAAKIRKDTKIPYKVVVERMNRGYTYEEAIKNETRNKPVNYDASKSVVGYAIFAKRIRNGRDREKAYTTPRMNKGVKPTPKT